MKRVYTDKKGRRRPLTSRKRYYFPVKSDTVEFQSTTLSPYHKGEMANAVDIAVPVGTEVYASRSGRVKDVGEDADGNKYVDIDHLDCEITDYSHLSKALVRKGQEVVEGQVIGLSGDTGDLGGLPPHLHFEVDALDQTEGKPQSLKFEWVPGSRPTKTKRKDSE
ncbi:MAG TPA: M23 family metallopeptidase [Nitrososphaerales archaeon]|nr:M23 family metallopeptidase [Nitrososphaerales archaeon]